MTRCDQPGYAPGPGNGYYSQPVTSRQLRELQNLRKQHDTVNNNRG